MTGGISAPTELRLEVSPPVSLRCLHFKNLKRNAPKLLFVPGWTSPLETWRHFLPSLVRRFDTFYLESREKPSAQISSGVRFGLNDYVDDLVASIRLLGLEESGFVLVGSSLGATTILAATAAGRCDPMAIAVITPNLKFVVPSWVPFVLRATPARYLELLKRPARWYVLRFRINSGDVGHQQRFLDALDEAQPSRLKGSALDLLGTPLAESQLGKIVRPCLVLTASEDPLHDHADVQRVVDGVIGAKAIDLKTFTATHGSRASVLVGEFIDECVGEA